MFKLKPLIILLIVFLLFSLNTVSFAFAKSTSKNSTQKSKSAKSTSIPKSYLLGIDQLNKGNEKLALKYFNATIKDYPKSEYFHYAHIFRVIITGAKINGVFTFINKLNTIAENDPDKEAEVYELINNNKKIIYKEFKEHVSDFLYSFAIVYNNYKKYKGKQISKKAVYFFKNDPMYTGFAFDLVPSKSEIPKAINTISNLHLGIFIADILDSNYKVEYENLFYKIAVVFTSMKEAGLEIPDEYIYSLYEAILEITKNDPYNETRLKVEEAMGI